MQISIDEHDPLMLFFGTPDKHSRFVVEVSDEEHARMIKAESEWDWLQARLGVLVDVECERRREAGQKAAWETAQRSAIPTD